MKRKSALAFALVALVPRAAAQFTLHADVVYKSVSGVPIALDVYEPDAPGPHPLVIWIHGGAWLSGDRNVPLARIQGLLDSGIAVASIDYRLTSEAALYGASEVVFPAQIDDVQDAILFLRANAAAYDLDVTRFGTWGTSAGGHLAALAGTLGRADDPRGDTSIQAIGDGYGPTDFFQMDADAAANGCAWGLEHDAPDSPESRLVGFDGVGEGIGVLRGLPAHPAYALVVEANPVTHIGAGDPPLFAVHGTNDCTVNIGQSHRIVAAYAASGLEATLVTHTGEHELPPAVVDDFHTFFARTFGVAETVEVWNEEFTVGARVALDEEASPADFDNETVRTLGTVWGGCNLGTTSGVLRHAVAVDPHGALSVDGGALFFNAGALSEGSRAYTRLGEPLDLSGGGRMTLAISKANAAAGARFRLLVRADGEWWVSEDLQTPQVFGPGGTVPLTFALDARTWARIDPSIAAALDLDELDDGGESGALEHLGVGAPALDAVTGIGVEVAAGNDLTRMFAIERIALGTSRAPFGATVCVSPPNSTGYSARLHAYGSPAAASNDVHLRVSDLPASQFGLLLGSPQPASIPLFAGTLCLASPLARHPETLGMASAAGTIEVALDLTALPTGAPPFTTAVGAGDTWHFQWWTRDFVGGPTANLSSAVTLDFE